MAFYDLNNNQINIDQFVQTYERYYFLNTPNMPPPKRRSITRRNKTNPFIEDNIQNILNNGLKPNDLVFIIAWKIGTIDHIQSNNKIVYKENFNTTLKYKNRFNKMIDVNHLVTYITKNFNNLINQKNPQLLFQAIFENRSHNDNAYFGIVGCLSLIYFFTQGNYPIYDRYAHIAINANQNNLLPNSNIKYNPIDDWFGYTNYFNNITQIFGNKNIQRNIDRSLWVYGHFFHEVGGRSFSC